MNRRDWMMAALSWPGVAAPRTAARSHGRAPISGDAVELDAMSGKVLRQQGDARRAGLPGSSLKPIVLAALLERGLVTPDERLECPGGFRLGSRNLECTHVHNAGPLNAVEALAASCNFWFAAMARRLGADGLHKALRRAGLAAQRASSEEEVCLQALGLARVAASPWTLSHAYAALLKASPPPAVLTGMRMAVEGGTAQRAASARVWIAGKTGTAPGGLPGSSAGWFAGWARRSAPPCAAGKELECLLNRPALVLAVRVLGATGGGAASDFGRELAEQWAQGN